MKLAGDTVIRCPRCKNLYIQGRGLGRAERSTEGVLANGQEASCLWSDGWRDKPNFPPVLVLWCESCQEWFFLEDAVELFPLPFGVEPGEYKLVPLWDELSEETYTALTQQPWPEEREILLRIRLMWIHNHRLRMYEGDAPARVESQENLERLSHLLDPKHEPLFSAEIFRLLGEFSRAKAVLDGYDPMPIEGDEAMRYGLIRCGIEERSILPLPNQEAALHRISSGFWSNTANTAREYAASREMELMPPPEDIFAFPLPEGCGPEPLLSFIFNYGSIKEDLLGVFLNRDGSWLYRHRRLFSSEQWEEFQGMEKEDQHELLDFWEIQRSYLEGMHSYERSFYYRTLYRIRYRARYNKNRFLEVKRSIEDFEEKQPRLYWKLFWASYTSSLGSESIDQAKKGFQKILEEDVSRRRLGEESIRRCVDSCSSVKEVKIQGQPLGIASLQGDAFGLPNRLITLKYQEEDASFIQSSIGL